MFEKRPKLSFFILGMFFGALCGGILVYYNSVITNENKISVNLIPQIVKQVIGVINNKSEKTTDSLMIKSETKASDDTLATNISQSESNIIENEAYSDQYAQEDSSSTDSLNASGIDESITIKTEELLIARELPVFPLENIVSNKPNKSDSLLAIVSGTKDESKKKNQSKIMVELWKSPINYKGYQASKNKIIFYGFTEIEEMKLFSTKNNMLLKFKETVYYIDFSNDFNSYEKVTDVSILSQINKLNP